MMERLRVCGGLAAIEREVSPRSDSGSSSGTLSPESVTVDWGRPLRLVYYDEKGKFAMDPEAVAALQLVKGPIAVVSICGRVRQGKSYILNQFMGRSSGFQVSSTHRPCTKGLWMWSAPLKQRAIDRTEYNLLLLDSEGIDAYDQAGTCSIQIFSLAVLLSSMFIYNQMGGIDEAALDRLSLVSQMSKHIRFQATASGWKMMTSELGQFSPAFIWLLRDFYLDLVENNRRITPREYLELALTDVRVDGKDTSAKNEIRESIRILFPDRYCFTLVRPLKEESDLQRLDQIPLDRVRSAFRNDLEALTDFVFERTRPKQIGATVMTGPILAGITQSFLDAINKGAVPTISSIWQSVEEAECRRAYDSATKIYKSYFDHTEPAEEAILREAHEVAMQKALSTFNSDAVGVGLARLNYEKLLHNFFKKTFEEYKRNAFLAADLHCSRMIKTMEEKLQAACYVPNAKVDDVFSVLDGLINDYESSTHGTGKSEMLVSFILKSLNGQILDLIERSQRQIEDLEREKSKLTEDVKRLHSSESEAILKAEQLETRLQERDKEVEELLSKNNEQRSNTVQVLESLLPTEPAAFAEVNRRAEALSVQLQATQSKLDLLQQELTSIRLNENAHDSKLRTAQGKRSRIDYHPATESVHDMELDGEIHRNEKRSKSTTSPLKLNQNEDGGSVYKAGDDQSQVNQETDSEDYTKFTVIKLKQELTKNGYGAELLQLKNPNKKDILALYSKNVLKK